ncbi:C2H2 finger domain transcription factor [Histoplasma capsulatum]|uniref:C2H2 finger domain transcription factor n=2 Tax=Histoplasma TaxID=5036 RepID=A0A8A1M9U2_AJECA|nr:C2H2 finger domain transcription factor [Histoplasma capsulatum]
MTVEGNRIELSSPLLSINALQTYCDLFFTKFNVSYPLIHQPTFDPDRIDTLLLAAMVSMGASYSTMEAHQLAVGMHDSLRNQLFSHQSFSPQPDLWVLQAMMLIDCFGKQRAGLKQREMSQLFHCVLIKLIRRSNCQLIRTSPVAERPDNLESAWRQAMDLEQRKRLAMLCFMWDTQHAVLFSQSLCMSAFEIRASLPCDEATWEARTAEEWFECSHAEKPHGAFLLVLKAYITPNTTNRPRYLNALSRIFLLHGLMSISSDLKRRDQTTLRSETPNLVGAWKARIGRSYDLWKNDFDADCMDMKLNRTSDPRKFVGLKTATNVMYHAAHITLNVEVLDLQIYAGAPHILGRLVTASDFDRSERVVTRWPNEDPHSAAKATRHASYILQDAIMNLNDWDETDVFHYPWCLYLATLTCWAFHLPTSSSSPCSSSTALVRRTEISNDNNSEQQGQQQPIQHPSPAPRIPGSISLNPRNEVATLVIAMTTCNTLEDLSSLAGKFDTTGLTCIMSQQLASVRWAVVHDAMKVLVTLSSR